MTKRFVNELPLETKQRLMDLAKQSGLSPVTLAVAWTLTRSYVGSTIIGVTHPDQLDEHLAAAETKLPEDVLLACDRISKEIRHPME